jgi:hypothetical protein
MPLAPRGHLSLDAKKCPKGGKPFGNSNKHRSEVSAGR